MMHQVWQSAHYQNMIEEEIRLKKTESKVQPCREGLAWVFQQAESLVWWM